MTRRRQFAPVAALAIVLGLMLAVPASAEPALTGYPSSMAVAGDSISRGYNADPAVPGESLARVWATGTEAAVSSHYSRILAANPAVAGRSYNDAQSGAGVLALNSQITSVNARGVDHVLILTGGNNACTTTEAGMLPVADFATNFQTAMNTLAGGSPNARVFVASIPDAHQLWALFKDDPNAVAVWNTYGICQSLLANPQSMAQEDVDRRARVRQRIVDFNAELARICGEVIHCRFDGNAVFNTVLTTADVAFDYFHPSLAGQAKLAAATWAATFDFSDQQAPSTTATTADVTGGLSLSLAAADDVGVRGIEHRLDGGAWTRYTGPVSVPYGSTLDYRAVDVNGNVEAARALTATVQPPTGVTATTLAAGAIAIRWSASPTAAVDPVTYTVLRSPAGAGTYVVVASGLGALSHSDAPAADGPYDYLVQAAVASSTSSAAGPATALSDRTPPTPSTLTASTGTATGTVELSWTAASDAGSGVAGYDVRYVQAQACPAASPGAYPSLIATGVTTSLAVGGLSSRTRYCFYVAARDAAGNLGDASAPKSARAK